METGHAAVDCRPREGGVEETEGNPRPGKGTKRGDQSQGCLYTGPADSDRLYDRQLEDIDGVAV